jgi:hypothetical protein
LSEIVNRTIEAYPALGYDPNYSYDYDGPIYAYGNLPDQVIANVHPVAARRVFLWGD